MTEIKLTELEKDETTKRIIEFIPNELGINLCSVEDVTVERTLLGEISKIEIKFVPSE